MLLNNSKVPELNEGMGHSQWEQLAAWLGYPNHADLMYVRLEPRGMILCRRLRNRSATSGYPIV